MMKIIFYVEYIFFFMMATALCLAEDKTKQISLTDLKADYKINDKDSTVTVKESLVYINQVPYKQIEYQNQFFYMKLSSPEAEYDLTRENCLRRPQGESPERIKFVYGKGEVKNRNSFFIKSLTINCGEQLDWKNFISRLKDLKIGVSIPDQENDKIKDKNIFFAPLKNSLNVQGSF
ncbi:MAG: hypothetical protein ACXVLQ_05255 [Bacteriovorax sp.]